MVSALNTESEGEEALKASTEELREKERGGRECIGSHPITKRNKRRQFEKWGRRWGPDIY